jgi:hypothetical protein
MARYFEKTNADSCIYFYEKAFKYNKNPLSDDLLYLSYQYAKKGDKGKFFKTYKRMQKIGFTYLNMSWNDNEDVLIKYKDLKKWKKIEKRPISVDIEFIRRFYEYVGADQFVRQNFILNKGKCGFIYNIDSLNNIRLKKYISENGFPNQSRVGMYFPYVLIIHFAENESCKNEWVDYYKPLLLKEAYKGNTSFTFIANLEDRFNGIWHNCQIYGTDIRAIGYKPGMTYEERMSLKFIIDSPIKDIENLDKRRAEMGLPPFYLEAKFLNIELPEGYKPNN